MKEKMQQLIDKLNEATKAYDEGHPIMTDKEWDDMYFELVKLERETGIALPDSPAHSIPFEVINELKKVKHNHDMLSLDKTKRISVVESFLKGKDWIIMAKLDGLTCSLMYVDGELISAETRGDGKVGEDILHNAKVIPSIPKRIDYPGILVVDGEIICTYENFEEFKDEYKNPRNFAAGSIRLLDSGECKKRNLTFIVWDIIKGNQYSYLSNNLAWIKTLGFETVPMYINDPKDGDTIENYINSIKTTAKQLSYPIDGAVFKYDNIKEYNEAGRTDHHFKGGLAYKFYDEIYDTKLRNIEWTMGRTGVLTPVAIYNDVNIEGTICNRASLHNLSIMNNLFHNTTPYVGQNIKVFKSNLIIPQIYSIEEYEIKDEVEYQFLSPPITCPYCGELTKVKQDNESQVLYCSNLNCNGKLINRLDHFCGKKGLDIKGLSKMTLEKLINWKWVNNISDIFILKEHRNEWIKKAGFGVASVDKILSAIEESRNCSTDKFICAIGIPLIGKVTSVALAKTFGTYQNFIDAVNYNDDKLYQIDGVGEVMIDTIRNFDYFEANEAFNYIKESAAATSTNGTELEGKVFCITGKLRSFKNRDELKSLIESKGGKVTGSVSRNTTYLINNDTSSTSSKNASAIKLNIPIINEDEFLTLVTPPSPAIEPSYLNSAT